MKALSMVDLFAIFFIVILVYSFTNFRPNWPQRPARSIPLLARGFQFRAVRSVRL